MPDTVYQQEEELLLPEWNAANVIRPPKRNPVLISGVARCGHVILLAGKGKIGKSWSAIELCVSVATGRGEWLGLAVPGRGACLYIDPEIDPKSLDNRFAVVCEAMGADAAEVETNVIKWSLRGVPNASMDAIVHDLRVRCEHERFVLVVVDSCSCFVDGDENSAAVIRTFSSKVLQIAAITGATVLLVHHFGKGKSGDRSAADRARGSSVWLDFPDASFTMTEVFPPSGEPSDYLSPNEYALILEECGNREFPRSEPVRLIFSYPIHRPDTDGITDGWKPDSSQRTGAAKTNELRKYQSEARAAICESKLLQYLYSNRIGAEGIYMPEASKICGCDQRTLTSYLENSECLAIRQVSQRKRYIVPLNPPEQEQPTLKMD